MKTPARNADDAFGFELYDYVTTSDGRKWVVYYDPAGDVNGGGAHCAVAACHWAVGAQRTPVPTVEDWESAVESQGGFPDHITLLEIGRLAGLDEISTGTCVYSSRDSDICRAVCEAFRGIYPTDPAFREACERASWHGIWPVIDASLLLTGEVTDAGDSLIYGDECFARITRADAIAAGLGIDEENGIAFKHDGDYPSH